MFTHHDLSSATDALDVLGSYELLLGDEELAVPIERIFGKSPVVISMGTDCNVKFFRPIVRQ